MKRRKPMRQFRKDRRPGNRPMTVEEAARVERAKRGHCVPCLVHALNGYMPLSFVIVGVTYDHKKSGNIRIGHMAGFGSCLWHHQGYPLAGWLHREMREKYGPSLMDGSRLFRETYGNNDTLIALQHEVSKLDPESPLEGQDLTAIRDSRMWWSLLDSVA